MYLNQITEMVYIGSSKYGLAYRHKQHLKICKQDKKSKFHKALSLWPIELWDIFVLEHCNSESELDAAETKWIKECNALDSNVGYNSYDSRYLRSAIAGGEAMKKRIFTEEERNLKSEIGKLGAKLRQHTSNPKEKKVSAFSLLTPEEKSEFFRNCGKKGALKAAENIMLRSS